MQEEILNADTSDLVAVILAIAGLVIAAIAAIYGRRAVIPPQRRLTVYSTKPLTASPAGVPITRTVITLASTGRHAIDSGRFDQGRPVVIDLGAKVRGVTVKTNRRSRDDPRIGSGSTTLILDPGLLNPGEYVALMVDTDVPPRLKGIAKRTSHSLIDTVVDGRRGRPPNLLVVKILLAAVAALLLSILAAAVVFDSNDTVGKYLRERATATIAPDHGRPGTCVVIRGENFGLEKEIRILAFSDAAISPHYTQVGDCPALFGESGGLSGASTRSTFDGTFLLRFAIPKDAKGTITVSLDGVGANDAFVYFWVD